MSTKRVNLLEHPDFERARIMKEAKTNLQEQLAEARLCQSLVENVKKTIDGVIINGEIVNL
jgi:hypothetical protein